MYNLPLNPVKFKHEKLISTYMNPLFTQLAIICPRSGKHK